MNWTSFSFVFPLASLFTNIVETNGSAPYEECIVVTAVPGDQEYKDNAKHLVMFQQTPYEMAPNKSVNYKHFSFANKDTKLLSSALHYNHKVLYLSDVNTAAIVALTDFDWRYNFNNFSEHIFRKGISRSFSKIAVDWVSNNVYWTTDPLFRWVGIQSGFDSNKDKSVHRILITGNLERPTSIAVHPFKKYLFLGDIGSSVVKIERSSLVGTERKTIISTGLLFPFDMEVDDKDNRLYWVDSNRDTIESADFEGGYRRIIRRMANSAFFSLSLYRDIVIVTDYSDGSMKLIHKNNGFVKGSMKLKPTLEELLVGKIKSDNFRSVTMYSAETQPQGQDFCVSKGCSDLCVSGTSDAVCLCQNGYQLTSDGVTCIEAAGYFHRGVVVTNATNICITDIRVLTTGEHINTTRCVFNTSMLPDPTDEIMLIDLDMDDRNIIIATDYAIYTVNILGTASHRRILASPNQITGLALDWTDGNIYFSSSDGKISLVSQTSQAMYTLFDKDLTRPRELNVLPIISEMIWISGTTNNFKIEKATLAGTERKTIVTSGNLDRPNYMTLDRVTNMIYWSDNGYIRKCKLDGKELSTVDTRTISHSPNRLIVYANYLIMTEDFGSTTQVKIVDTSQPDNLRHRMVFEHLGLIRNLKVLDTILQADEAGPCDLWNGGCDQICIPIGRNRLCRCDHGYKLGADNQSCISTPLTDNYLYVSDWTHSKIYQLSVDGAEVRALNSSMVTNPAGVAYNPLTDLVYWCDTNELFISQIHRNGTGYKVIADIGYFGSFADRLAIDFTSGNIYYTANRKEISGYAGIGVVSRDGLHKKLITDHSSQPRDIVLDLSQGILFWSNHAKDSPFVSRANMDGTDVVTVVRQNIIWPNGLAIDHFDQKLYISDGSLDTVQRCSYDGLCTQIISDPGAHLMDILLLGSHLYLMAWNRPYIKKIKMNDVTQVSNIGMSAEFGRLDAMAGYMSSDVAGYPVSAKCAPNNGKGPCSTFCLPTAGTAGYTCACEDGVDLLSDGKTCTNVQTTMPTTSTSTTPTMEKSSKETTTKESPERLPIPIITGSAVGGAILIIIIVILVCVLMRRGKSTGQYPPGFANPRFENPETDISTVFGRQLTELGRPNETYSLLRFDDNNKEPGEEPMDQHSTNTFFIHTNSPIYDEPNNIPLTPIMYRPEMTSQRDQDYLQATSY